MAAAKKTGAKKKTASGKSSASKGDAKGQKADKTQPKADETSPKEAEAAETGAAGAASEEKAQAGGRMLEGGGHMPLFYQEPVAISLQRHKDTGVSEEPDYTFANITNSLPLTAGEFVQAVRHYPIVFSPSDPAVPVAIVGLSESNNMFVNEKGHWRPGCYIPMYVRRYPFIIMQSGRQDNEYVLCIDEASNMVGKGGRKLMDEKGERTELMERAIEFCQFFQQNYEYTRKFCDALSEKDLLSANRADLVLDSGERLGLTGFRVVNEEKFSKLDDKTFLQWRDEGFLAPIYLHLASQSNWTVLARMASEQDTQKKGK